MSTESTSSGVCSLVGHQLLLTRSTCPWVPTSQTHHKYLLCLCALCLYSHASVEWTDLPTTSTCSVCLRDDCTVTPQWNELTYLPQVPVAFVCVMTVQSRLSGMIDLPTTSTCSVCLRDDCTVTPQWNELTYLPQVPVVFVCIMSVPSHLSGVPWIPPTWIQGYLFTSDIKMCTGICLGVVTIIQKTNSTQQLQV